MVHDIGFRLHDETKKQILMALGSNPTIKDGKLTIQANEWLVPIEKDYPKLEVAYKRLEPAQMPENKERMAHLRTIRSQWIRDLDSNQKGECGLKKIIEKGNSADSGIIANVQVQMSLSSERSGTFRGTGVP